MVNDGLVSASGDTRGIVDPAAMMRHVDFARYEPGPELVGLVEWFWSVQWDLPDGQFHDQEVLNHPAGNISIGTIDDSDLPLDPPEGRLYGVFTEVSKRHLVGAGWTVAARISVGALGAFLDGPAKAASNARLDIVKGLPGLDRPDIVRDVSALGSQVERVDVLRQALSEVVGRRCASMLAEAREVVDLASLAERDRSIRRVEQLAEPPPEVCRWSCSFFCDYRWLWLHARTLRSFSLSARSTPAGHAFSLACSQQPWV